jgi:predicted DNA-binding protein YlxM (UPF0122 family)
MSILANIDNENIKFNMSIYVAGTVFGGLVGRIFSGFIATTFSYEYVFYSLSVAILISILLIRKLDFNGDANIIKPRISDVINILKDKRFLIIYFIMFFVFFVFSGVLNVLPFRAKEISNNVSEFQIALLYLGYGMGILVLSPTHMAVENVFERLDLDALGLNDGEIILNINTENESLKAYHSDVITGISRTQIADEQEIMKSAKEDLNKKRRDAETLVFDFKNRIEQEEILEKNISNDIAHIEDKIKKEKLTLKELEKRLALIESNSILNSIASLFTSGTQKAEEIKNSISFSKKQIEIYSNSLFKSIC